MTGEPEKIWTPGELLDRGFITFATIPHPMRGWAIIGCYMGFFAILENTLVQRLGEILGTDLLVTVIVGRNMGAIEKVRALRTMVNLAVRKEDRAWLDDLLKRAAKAAEQRNIVAHTSFGQSTKSDGIEFYAAEAKGRFHHPQIDWSIKEADAYIDELRAVENLLDSPRAKAACETARDLFRDNGGPDAHNWFQELFSGARATPEDPGA